MMADKFKHMQVRDIQRVALWALRHVAVARVLPSVTFSRSAVPDESVPVGYGFDPEWLVETAQSRPPELTKMSQRPWNRDYVTLACVATRPEFKKVWELCRAQGVHLYFDAQAQDSEQFYYEVIAVQFIPGDPPKWV